VKRILAMLFCLLLSALMLFGCDGETTSIVSSTAAAVSNEVASKEVTIDNCKTTEFINLFKTDKYYMGCTVVQNSSMLGDSEYTSKMAIDGKNRMIYLQHADSITHYIIKDNKIYVLFNGVYRYSDCNGEIDAVFTQRFDEKANFGILQKTGTEDGLYYETFKTDEVKSTYYYDGDTIEKIVEISVSDGETTTSTSSNITVSSTIPDGSFDFIKGTTLKK